ncbi:phage tail tape-measure protein [Sinorhizobium medicae]|uniref:phage tail length tape measure family protein n=1 Tax=Sinorhizobium medicae TaxID=110321 RepID=UPI001295AD5E|nr:phage tail length tape measure family protein [Sinorhizobium medicae]MDX0548517.1 phage tail tape-measure protein [Sinorhizobium medicae]MDX0573735.1 phage tail tape-measure protein [Sinorhizobium medicae]MDX0672534.1 phage tail tape-measure protein [Sinorhizobium medicae]MDX0709930.1 phage tail tape-measure protein [Sinorhizobium medicae]MQV97529.1 phage tail tape-measure protein [Sinorhizobium medicae]
MAELATLGIEAKTTGVDQATSKLDKLTGAAKRAESAVEGIGPSSSKAGQMAASAANVHATALNAEAAAANKAAGAMRLHNQAANQNVRGMQGAAGHVGNLAAQFQDIGVSAAMSMSPMQIALQQGTQISAVLGPMGAAGAVRALGQAFLTVISPVSLVTIAIVGLAAAGLQLVDWGKLAASVLTGLADVLQTIAPYAVGAAAALALLYAPAIIGGIISVIALLARLSVAAVAAGAAMLAANPAGALILGITAAIAAANIFRDELAQIFGRDIVADAKNAVNFIIGAFVGAFSAIKATWSALPGAIGDFVYATANAVVAGTELMVNMVVGKIDELIGKINASMKSLPFGIGDSISVPTIGQFNFGRVENPYAGQQEAVGQQARDAISGAMSTDYVGGFGEAISRGASAASSKLKELAKDLTTVDEKSGKKGRAGGGGKTEAEQYSDIVDGANRRISALKAEQEALGMTEQAALALKYETDLLNQAQQKGIELTAAQKTELSGLANQMAATEVATKNAKEALDFAKDATKGFLSDLRSGLANSEGFWKSFGKAAMNVLDKIISKVEDELVNALFSLNGAGTGGGGGLFGSILGVIGKIFGFASGGYTGKGAASAVAGVVHGGEYVFSKRATDKIGVRNLDAMHRSAKGYQSGGNVTRVMPAANQNAGGVIIVRTVSEVRNGNLVPVMTEVAGEVSGQKIRDASPQIIAASVNEANRQAPAAVAKYQQETAGGDYRTA